jgi:hypothetical protein
VKVETHCAILGQSEDGGLIPLDAGRPDGGENARGPSSWVLECLQFEGLLDMAHSG